MEYFVFHSFIIVEPRDVNRGAFCVCKKKIMTKINTYLLLCAIIYIFAINITNKNFLFMKEKILKALKTRFAKYGLSDKVLEGAAALIEPSVTYEEDIDKVIPDYEPMLKAMQSELDTVRSQKSELETKIKSLSVKPHEKGGTEDETKEKDVNATQTPDWAKAIIESNKQLAERLNGIEGQKLVDKRKREIETIVEKLPETLRRPYQRLSVDGMTDEQFTKLSADIEQEVSEIAKQATAKGSIFTPPSAAQTAATDSEKKEIDEVVSSVVENNKII